MRYFWDDCPTLNVRVLRTGVQSHEYCSSCSTFFKFLFGLRWAQVHYQKRAWCRDLLFGIKDTTFIFIIKCWWRNKIWNDDHNLNWGWSTLNGILGAKNFLSCQKLILIGQTISLKRNNFYELIYPISEHFLSNTLQDQNFFKNCLFLGTFLVKRDIRGKISWFENLRIFGDFWNKCSAMIEFGTICWK